MCGIFGIAGREGRAGGAVERQHARASLDLLAERGPDDSGWYEGPGILLGHTRLSIMDLSAAGHQPMSNDDGSVSVVFNGEIYRFWELRKELEGLGHRFRSRCDTEVIVRGYEQWGRAVLERLDGMFALGLWDSRSATLLLARDRLGKKPLFWTVEADSLGFSSLIRPLVASGLAEPVIDAAALREYFFLNYILGPKTIFRDVKLLEPGSWLEYRRGQVTTGRYWRLGDRRAPTGEDTQSAFEAHLVDAVRDRLVSDAPVGMFLSGGVDSAVITALAQRESSQRQLTFSVGFEERSYDERSKAERASRALGTEHHSVLCRPADVAETLPDVLRSADHLLADQSMIPLALLAREARQSVKVVLTGDGGDELLAGYSTYRALALAAAYTSVTPAPLRRLLARATARLPTGTRKMSPSMLAARFFGATTGSLAEAHSSWRAIWQHDEIDELVGGRFAGDEEWRGYAAHMPLRTDWPLVKSAVHADVHTWLVDSILAKVDRSTMAVGLEARSPFLDNRLIELCFDTMLGETAGHRRKAAVRRFAHKLLGPRLAGVSKAGFQTPLSTWFAGPLRDYVKDRLATLTVALPGVLDPAVLTRVELEHAAGKRDHALKLWSLVVLAEWLRLYPEARID